MKIAVIGTGYVGLVQGVILAEFGMNVVCVDVDLAKIEKLKQGIVPIYEAGLKEVMESNINAGRLKFSTEFEDSIINCDVVFIAVGTPPQEDGSADLRHVISVAKSLGKYLNSYTVIVNKSTVPIGTAELVRQTIISELKSRNENIEFDVVSNPEFLQEGKALQGCLNPDRIIIGSDSERAIEVMKKVYHSLKVKQIPFVFTDLKSAELTKYAANAFLAVKISFINEISRLAETVGANTSDIAYGMGLDARIAPAFLQCGPGYGGSCFPKDTQAIVDIAKKNNESLKIIEAAIEANKLQKLRMIKKIKDNIKNLNGKTIAVLGLSFKPDTDDMRDAPALDILPALIKECATIKVYCPQGMNEAKWRLDKFKDYITYCDDEYECCNLSDALVIMTEWSKFSNLDLKKIKSLMKDNYLFDLRNIFIEDGFVRSLFKYFPVGQK